MALLWLLTVLSSVFLAGSYKLPARKRLGQDGASREDVGASAASTTQWLWLDNESSPSPETLDSANVSTANLAGEEDMEANRLPAETDSPSAAPPRWEWKATGGGGHESPQLPRRKRQAGVAAKGKATPVSKGKTAGASHATATSDTLGTTASGVAATAVVFLNTTGITSPTQAPPLTSSEAMDAKGRRRHVDKAGTTVPRVSSETGTVPSTTEFWSWLDDESTASPETFVSTVTLMPGFHTTRPGIRAKGKDVFPLRTATAASTTEWLWPDDESTPSSETLASSNVSTTTPSQGLGAAPRARGKSGFPHATATAASTTEWLWSDDESTPSSETLASSNVSTMTPSQGLGAAPRARGKSGSPHATATAASTTEWPWLDDESTSSSETVDRANVSTATPSQGLGPPRFVLSGKGKTALPPKRTTAGTTPARADPPAAGPLGGTGPLVGKCLLAIFLLALVAGIFIVITGVLATMLWRQKRAYKMNQQHHTEMVCISSLLATEEAEEAARRAPRVKRVKMLGENGSEAEMDNLTLNSFLPEH
ncbi:P-selectin glycoprotein ligand 1 [Elgaria multicarinata webbii]|uniref:P-selectin glycoprotein ligand 1 n=1 Tax=Elgaria multicarinata webbii TaxID=159646 RepID=UPI002FCD582D